MAGRNTLHVEVVTAERELFNGEAELVSAPGSEGRLGILPEHEALLSLLGPGLLRIKLRDEEEPIFVSGGFLEVYQNSVTILADTAEYADEIDQARAEEARRRAEERLHEVHSETERAELQAALERAINRLSVAQYGGQRTRRRMNRVDQRELQ